MTVLPLLRNLTTAAIATLAFASGAMAGGTWPGDGQGKARPALCTERAGAVPRGALKTFVQPLDSCDLRSIEITGLASKDAKRPLR